MPSLFLCLIPHIIDECLLLLNQVSVLVPQALACQPPTGGLRLGGGGLGIPMRKCSPVSLRFQRTLCITGWFNLMAPFCQSGHSATQQPPYQHSSGYNTIGGLPFSGFGARTSIWHTSTHVLHPLQTFWSNATGLFGVGRFGAIYTFCLFMLVLSVIIITRNVLHSSLRAPPSSR
jgi:hypothetical protein